jgi:hypothetical protein
MARFNFKLAMIDLRSWSVPGALSPSRVIRIAYPKPLI